MKSKKTVALTIAVLLAAQLLPGFTAYAATLIATSNSVTANSLGIRDSSVSSDIKYYTANTDIGCVDEYIAYTTNGKSTASELPDSSNCSVTTLNKRDSTGGQFTYNYAVTANPGELVKLKIIPEETLDRDVTSSINDYVTNTSYNISTWEYINGYTLEFIMPSDAGHYLKLASTRAQNIYYYLTPAGTTADPSAIPDVAVQEALLNYTASNLTRIGDIQNVANGAIDTSKYSVTLTQTGYQSATESADGYISGNCTVTDMSTGKQTTTSFNIPIPKLAQSLDTIANSLSNFIKSYGATNSSSASDFTNAVKITNSSYNVSVNNWSLTPSTDTSTGKLSCTVNLNEGSTVKQSFPVSKTISELPTTTVTAKAIIANLVSNYTATNYSDKAVFLSMCQNAVSSNIIISIPSWILNKSSETSTGSLIGSVTIGDGSTTDNVPISKTIDYLDESIASAQNNVQDALGSISPNNYITRDEIINITKTAVNSNYFSVSVDNFQNVNSTEISIGSLKATIIITDKQNSSNNRTVTLDKTIPILAQTLDGAKTIVEDILSHYSVSNETSENEVLNAVNKSINTNYITAKITKFELNPSSEIENGNLEIEVELSNGINTETVDKSYTIGVENQSVPTVKRLFETALKNFKAVNVTSQDDILNSVLITNPNIKVNITDFKVDTADESKSGKISGNINISNSSTGETATVPINIKISQLQESVTTVRSLYEKALSNFVAINNTQPKDILSLVYIDNEDISVKMKDDYSIRYANDIDKGLIKGTILITNISTGEAAEVPVSKEISLLSQELATAVRAVQNTIYSYNPTNNSTFDDLLIKCNLAVTKNITVYYKVGDQPQKVDSDEFNTGYMEATMEVSDGTNTVKIPFSIVISKTAQTLDGVKTLMEATLKNFTATNDTTERDVLNAVDTNIRDNSITATFGTTGTKVFYKEDATVFKLGKITGEINVSETTGASVQVPVALTIAQLDQTLEEAEQAIDIEMPNFVVNNNTTEDDIKSQIEAAVSSNIVVTTRNFSINKATLDSDGQIKVTVTLIDSNTKRAKEVPLVLTITKLQQTLDQAKSSVENVLNNITPSNSTTAADIQKILQNSVGSNINVTVEDDFNNKNSTESSTGFITGTITIENTITGESIQIPLTLTIQELTSTSNTSSSGGNSGGGNSSSSSNNSTHETSTQDQSNTTSIDSGTKSTGWKNVNGVWHYYDANGKMITGWIEIDNLWYYFKSDGSLTTGWLLWNNNWYYLNEKCGETLGVMQTGWIQWNGKYYYLNPNENGPQGAMETGWIKWNNNWYYLRSDGSMKIGWLNYNVAWYYLGSNGVMAIGWFEDADGAWYYLQTSGVMAHDITIDGYYLNSTGAWVQ